MTNANPTKPYDLAFEVRENYLYAVVSGEHDNFEISSAYWREIGEKVAELGMDKVLIVEDIAEQSPLVDVYNLSAQLVEIGFRGVAVAFVDRYSSHQELNDFGVTVSTNRGLIGSVFDNDAEAESWLLSQ